MLPIGSPLKPSQIDLLMRHGRLRLNDYRWICCENDEVFIKEEKIPLAQAFGWGESLGDFRVNFMFIISTSSWCWRFWFLKIF